MFDLLPGYYLFRTRLRSWRGAVSYGWLEFLPSMLMLGVDSLLAGLWFGISHLAFLGLYEVGYRFNDQSVTSRERDGLVRPHAARLSASGWWVLAAPRVLFVAAVAMATVRVSDAGSATAFALSSISVSILLYVHTLVGECVGTLNPARWLTFGWLAGAKYLPAALACVGTRDALTLCATIFILYGAGRIIEYAINKHGGMINHGVLDVNVCWFLVALPLAIILHDQTVRGNRLVLIGIAVFGLHHVIAASIRVRRHVD